MVGKRGKGAIRVFTGFHTALHGRIVAGMATRTPRPERQSPAGKPARPGARAAAPSAVSNGSVRPTLTPEDWIAAATQVLVDQGIDHVRVDTLAGKLQVTRGSFYWHFRDREDLLRRVLQAWAEMTTLQLTRRLESSRTDPREQLRDVISLPFRGRAAARAARIELAIRAWARRDEMARQAVDDADASRIAYHAQVFVALGFQPGEARMRAFVLYSYEVAESLMHRQGTAAERQARKAFVEELMQQPLRQLESPPVTAP
jgi:AcrR family transcriptional regulator